MPHHVNLIGKAGSAVLWHGCIWHTAMNNDGVVARRMLLYNYTHFGMKQYDQCIATRAFQDHVRKRSLLCHQLMCLQRMPR